MFKKDKSGKFDAKFVVVSGLVLVILLACFVMAVNTTVTLNGQASTLTYFAKNNSLFTFIVTAAGAEGINYTNLTLPAGLMSVNISNGTSSIVANVSIQANVILWQVNSSVTSKGGMINSSGTANFWINLTGVDAAYNLTIRTIDNSTNVNQTNISIVLDSTRPVVIYISPSIGANITSSVQWINVSANDTWLNKTVITILSRNLAVVSSVYTNNTNYDSNTRNVSTYFSLVDGNYTINITAFDNAGNVNQTLRNITIDATGPAVVLENTVRYGLNISNTSTIIAGVLSSSSRLGILTLNATVIDAMISNVSYVLFNITNATDPDFQNATFRGIIEGATGRWSNSSWNLTKYPEGIYKITVIANDSLGNVNMSEIGYVRIDRTNPNFLSLSKASESNTNTTDLLIDMTVSDAITGIANCTTSSGTLNAALTRITHLGLTCGTSYSYNVTCYDFAANLNSTIGTFSTAACGPASSSGSGSSSTATPTIQTSIDSAAGYTKTMVVAEQLKFTLPSATDSTVKEIHSVFIQSLIGQVLTIKVSSTPQIASLNVGETKSFDVNEDSYYDVSVKFNSLASGTASLTIKAIHEAVPGTPAAVEQAAAETAAAETSAKTGTYTWVIIGVIVLVVIVLVLWFFLRKKEY